MKRETLCVIRDGPFGPKTLSFRYRFDWSLRRKQKGVSGNKWKQVEIAENFSLIARHAGQATPRLWSVSAAEGRERISNCSSRANFVARFGEES